MTAHTPKHAKDISAALVERYGELIGGSDLWRALGLRSERTFQRLAKADRLPVRTFSLEGRRDLLARTRDVGAWLESLGEKSSQQEDQGGGPSTAGRGA
jgi:hypothetical protein